MIDQGIKLIKAYVLHISTGRTKPDNNEEMYSEAVSLAEAMEVEVVCHKSLHVKDIHPSTLIRSGAISELKDSIAANKVDLLIANTSLSPSQQRNLEKDLNVKVIDRTGLILEIFGLRAKTKEGVLQVELAALTYQKSRLVRAWTHLERQRGGFGFIGGPGESQVELDRRMLERRLIKIEDELKKVKRTREIQRKSRKKIPTPTVSLVGYTNAGKSTLFNSLTNSEVFAKDLLFATLDPTIRRLKLPQGGEVVLSDTVGFIADLPTQLIASFQATLEEVLNANCILHVHDISNKSFDDQYDCVVKTLENIGINKEQQQKLVIHVFNKSDKSTNEDIEIIKEKYPNAYVVSALNSDGLDELINAIQIFFNENKTLVEISVPVTDGAFISWCHGNISIVSRKDTEEKIILSAMVSASNLKKVEKYIVI